MKTPLHRRTQPQSRPVHSTRHMQYQDQITNSSHTQTNVGELSVFHSCLYPGGIRKTIPAPWAKAKLSS